MTVRHLFVLALTASFSLSGVAHAQTDQERAGARLAATQGVKAYEAGNHQDAVNYLERAESLVHSPIHLLFLGRANEKLGRLVQAREAYLKLIREQIKPTDPQSFRDAQAAAQVESKPLETRVPSVTLRIEGAPAENANVVLDGKPLAAALVGVPLPINPGEHNVEVTGDAIEGTSQRITIAEGTQSTVVLKVTPRAVTATAATPGSLTATGSSAPTTTSGAAERPVPTGVYIGLAATGVFAVGAAVTGILASSNHSDFEDANKGQDPAKANDLKDKGQTLNIVTDVFLGGAVIAGGVTAFLYFTRPETHPATSSERVSVTPFIGPHGGSVSLSGRF
jgi:hypothetical protein